MHCNDLKYGDIVDFCYITKVFFWGGAYFGPLVKKIRIWDVMKSNGHNITRNGFYDPKNP